MYNSALKSHILLEATPTLDTNAYATGDRMGSVLELVAAFREGRPGTIRSITVLDKDNTTGVAFDILFFQNSPTIASADNAAIDITDANLDLANYLGHINIPAANYIATASNSIATVREVNLPFVAAEGSRSIYALCVSRGAVTHTASGLDIHLLIEQD